MIIWRERRLIPHCNLKNEGCKIETKAECFACGLSICISKNCSRRIQYYRYGRRRICKSCEIEHQRYETPEK